MPIDNSDIYDNKDIFFLKTFFGSYITLRDGLLIQSKYAQLPELRVILFDNGSVALISGSGDFIADIDVDGNTLLSKFIFKFNYEIIEEHISVAVNGRYLSARNDGSVKLVNQCGRWEKFKIVRSYSSDFVKTAALLHRRLSNIPWSVLRELSSQSLTIDQEICQRPEMLAERLHESGLFDAQFYLLNSPEAAESGLDPLMHYATYGWKEKANPAIWFDSKFYVKENFSIDFEKQDPFLHFIANGCIEKRRPNPKVPKKRERLIVTTALDPTTLVTAEECLHSLLNQTHKPDKIVVYVPNGLGLTPNMAQLASTDLEFRWVADKGEYTRLMPALEDFPNDIIVSCCSWRIYSPDWLDSLWKSYFFNPCCLHSACGNRLHFQEGEVKVDHLDPASAFLPGAHNIPACEYGLLVPAGYLFNTADDESAWLRHAPDFMDAWIWAKSVASGRLIAINGTYLSLLCQGFKCGSATGRRNEDAKAFERQIKASAFYHRAAFKERLGVNVFEAFNANWVKKIYKKYTRCNLSFDDVQNFNEKIQFMKIYDDNPIKSLLSDKYLVRSWITSKLGRNSHLPDLYGVYDDPNDIDLLNLPNKFVLKSTHASGHVILVKDKNNVDWSHIRSECFKWLGCNHTFRTGESQYFDIIPRIICEEYLGSNIFDYKFLCFNGPIETIWVDTDRFTDHRRTLFTPNWDKMDINLSHLKTKHEIPKPLYLNEMSQIARNLSEGFPHMRVDFLINNIGFYVGELTFSSGSGCEWISSDKFNQKLGDLIDLKLCI